MDIHKPVRMTLHAVCENEPRCFQITTFLSGDTLPENLRHLYLTAEQASTKAHALNNPTKILWAPWPSAIG